MKVLKKIYSELLAEITESNQISYDTVKFCFQRGTLYPTHTDNLGLLVVGRACNGWTAYSDDVDDLFGEGDSSMFSTEPFSFLKEENNSHYNSKQSAFWRVIKSITATFHGKERWSDYIAWTNLYKVSPEEGNPNRTLGGLQYKKCVEILQHEVEMLSPGIIIFFTGDDSKDWLTEDFIRAACGGIVPSFRQKKWDKYRLLYSQSINGRTIIITEHPQGKKENLHIEAIISCIQESHQPKQKLLI